MIRERLTGRELVTGVIFCIAHKTAHTEYYTTKIPDLIRRNTGCNPFHTQPLFIRIDSGSSNEIQEVTKMKRFVGYVCGAVFLAGFLVGCQGNLMSQSEKLFVKMVNKTAGKLDSMRTRIQLSDQDIHEGFVEAAERCSGSEDQRGREERKS
jgi:hypothetical protein